MSMIENERTKLLANAIDRASTACITVGVLTPLAGLIYNIGGLRDQFTPMAILAGTGGWILTAIILHLIARKILKGLKP